MGGVRLKTEGVGAYRIRHLPFTHGPEELLKGHGVHGLLSGPAGKWEAAPSGGDAQLASRAADAPAGAREEPERVECALAQLDLVEQDERGLLGQSDALVVCHAVVSGMLV